MKEYHFRVKAFNTIGESEPLNTDNSIIAENSVGKQKFECSLLFFFNWCYIFDYNFTIHRVESKSMFQKMNLLNLVDPMLLTGTVITWIFNGHPLLEMEEHPSLDMLFRRKNVDPITGKMHAGLNLIHPAQFPILQKIRSTNFELLLSTKLESLNHRNLPIL